MHRSLPVALAVCVLVAGCRRPSELGSPRGQEVLRDLKISRTKYPLLPLEEGVERVGTLRSEYLARIGWPRQEPDLAVREKAYAQLQAMRKAQQITHVSAGYCTRSGRDQPACPSGPGGPGG